MERRIPCVFYPSTCMIVDDQETFLDNVIFKIDSHSICKTFSDPHLALEYARTAKKNEFLAKMLCSEQESADRLPSSGDTPLHINTTSLYKHIYDNTRFSEISVVVVDFQMPMMNGIEFCKKLSDNSIKKIMLTGEADEYLAVQLFNEGVIHQFIRKGAPNVYDLLNQSIKAMKRLYFQNRSDSAIDGLSTDPESCFGDPLFIDVFENTCKKIGASSYYLIEPSGSYLFLDDVNKPTWLIVKTQNELSDFAEQMQEFKIDSTLVTQVRNGTLVPYFHSFDNCMDALEKRIGFSEYLLPAEKVESTKSFSYSVVTELPEFPLQLNKILSFKEFISK